ncbi:MAG: hypothetical protein GKR94_07145 [Gammaproteobacteria bacterium]|nr:hypothetical protein [Gammaproteobacteria bacterium]
MNVPADRVSGAFFLLFGLAAYSFVIPASVETVAGGNIAPDTVPNRVSLIIAGCGLWLLIKPTRQKVPPARLMLTTAGLILALAVALFTMSIVGFTYVAPVLALGLMTFMGERRPLWLALGAVGMPALIGLFVVYGLDRALP